MGLVHWIGCIMHCVGLLRDDRSLIEYRDDSFDLNRVERIVVLTHCRLVCRIIAPISKVTALLGMEIVTRWRFWWTEE